MKLNVNDNADAGVPKPIAGSTPQPFVLVFKNTTKEVLFTRHSKII